MSRNTKKRSEGHLTPVEYNEYGQLVGGSRSNVSSQLGSVVRATVSININSWKDVSVVDKNKIWDTMKKTYDLDPKQKQQMLKDAGKYFRNWKTNLTRVHVYDALKKYPNEFPPALPFGFENVITPDEWLAFVNSRLTPEWQRKREEMQNYRALNKYNHNLSRGGYVRIEEMLMEQSGKSLTELDRADLWSMGRRNAKGELIGEASEIQKNIDHYRQLQAEGKWAPDGPDDVLTRALGTPEPRGRVRDGGHGVSRSVYWNTPTPTSTKNKSKASSSNDDIRKEFEERFRKQEEEHRQQAQRLEERLQQQDELLRKLLAQQSGSGSNVGVPPAPSSYYVPDPPVPPAQASYYTPDPVVPQAEHHIVALQPLLQEGRACQLAIGSVSNIVASGTLIEREAGNNFQVMITSVLNALLSLLDCLLSDAFSSDHYCCYDDSFEAEAKAKSEPVAERVVTIAAAIPPLDVKV
ncbi:uncharacterized protein LOC133785860 [Humulus lupulus]|uniref:uncharacterized protein LOC133785860 n=1 Tax=Humulus lupulus TaxID=3486 RepID=UPI002B415BC9|nr:uncharacterized protein LOC133785860 [Humulus lupulus]